MEYTHRPTDEKVLERLQKLILVDELTLAIYHIARTVIMKIVPDEIDKYPEYNFTEEQEQALLLRMAELHREEKTADLYQEN